VNPRATTAAVALLAAILPATRPLPAQESIDLPGRDVPLDAGFEEVFRVGVMDGEPWEMFGHVRHVGFDGNGNLYIVDGPGGSSIPVGGPDGAVSRSVVMMDSEGVRVLVFDPSGNFVREFGSSGEGPGEFNRPAGFAVLRDGTTVVNDRGHSAYQLFGRNGEFLRMVRGSAGLGTLLPDPRGGGVFAGNPRDIVMRRPGDASPPDPPTSRPVLHLDLGGDSVQTDTIVEGWLPPRGEAGVDLPRNLELSGDVGAALRGAFAGLSQPAIFEPPFLMGVLPDGSIVHSDSSAYSLQVTPPNAGGVSRFIRRPLRPRPVTRAMEKQYRENTRSGGLVLMQGAAAGGAGRSGSGQSFSFDMPEPGFYPEISVLRGLATTWDGRIWVRRRGEEWRSDGPIDVVTADGHYVGTFAADATEMPDAFGPGGLAAFIELDALDVAGVVVRRLPAAVR